MSNRLGMVVTAADGSFVADWSGRARGVVFNSDENGFLSLSGHVDLPVEAAWRYFEEPALRKIVLSDGETVWEGRLNKPELVPTGLRISAQGPFNSLLDIPIAGTWVDTRLEIWEQLTEDDPGGASSAPWRTDKKGRLYGAPSSNQTLGSTKTLWWYYQQPQWEGTPANYLERLTFDYDIVASPTGADDRMIVYAVIRTPSSTSYVSKSVIDTPGSGSIDVSHSCTGWLIGYNYSQAGSTYTGDIGDEYVKITDVIVYGRSTIPVTSKGVIDDLVGYVNGVNPNWVSSETDGIANPGVTLEHEVYQDVTPGSIVRELAAYGDGSVPWEAVVWEDQKLLFRERGSAAETYYVWLDDIQLMKDFNNLANRGYGVFQNPRNQTWRTELVDNAESQAASGIIRGVAVSSESSTASKAEQDAGVVVANKSTVTPRAKFVVRRIVNRTGGVVDKWRVRALDRIKLLGLPATVDDLDRIESFLLTSARYDVDQDRLEIEPEDMPATLEAALSR